MREQKRNLFTLAVSGETPSPARLETAKALAIHDVIVSGIVVLTVTVPFLNTYKED